MPPIISIVGKSESGKTTLLEKLIPELKRRGYRIGVIKHAVHEFVFDKPGKDSWRHKAAGAEAVLVAAPGTIVMVKNGRGETLDELGEYFRDMDLVLTEGFKHGDKPQIEIFRKERHQQPLSAGNSKLIAMVTNADIQLNVPTFGLEDIVPLADLIEETFL
ncbi:MAG: molybdopterin-guanine dinucleotide biosynthesis protein B [Thermodesulfobacteriota bacterium]